MSAQSRGWGAAPVSRSKIVPVRAALSGATFPGGVHRNIQQLVHVLLETTERRGYMCVPGWCWGYAPRRIGNDPRRPWSNHAWGLAVDINAPENPYSDRFITDMPSWMPAMWKACGFRWGGDYSGPYDAMHYEYMRRPENVQSDLERAVRFRDKYTGPKEDDLTDELKHYLEHLEARLIAQIDVATAEAARSVDKSRNLAQDIVGLRKGVRALLHKVGVPPSRLLPDDDGFINA